MKKVIEFSYNWNKKLHCKAFTTLRLSNDYGIGEVYQVRLNNTILGNAVLVDRKRFTMTGINDFIAYIDTGYSTAECKEILMKMHKKRKINWVTQKINFYLFKFIDANSQPEFKFPSDADEVREEYREQETKESGKGVQLE